MGTTVLMLARRQVHLPRGNVGRVLEFADGSVTRVYRETRVDHSPLDEPCVLVVAFRLRLVHGPLHRVFEAESLLNTPLFAGFPGLVTKLWCAHDSSEVYRGVYEWDGPERARHYASALWRVLELVCVPGSIRYTVLPGLRRNDILSEPALMQDTGQGPDSGWWRLVRTA